MKKIFAFILAMLLLTACAAFAETGEFLYEQRDDGVYITGYTGSDTILRLPESIDGQSVTGVASAAFAGNSTIVELYVPDSCRIIEEEAFAGSTALRDVYLGSGIEALNARAFADCPMLLSVSIVQYDFEEDPTVFEGSERLTSYNGADVAYFWENSSGADYDLLYVAACDMMSRGEFQQARDIFLSIYGYELSADNYFYCSARVYESRGDIEAAKAIYALMPDLNDCAARLNYYGGMQEVVSFFEGPSYDNYYSTYFGSGGRYEAYAAEVPADEIIGGADEPTNIIVGEGINPAATAEPTADPTAAPVVTVEPNPALMAYHVYADDMPFEFNDMSASEGYYAIYYYYDDLSVVHEYVALFEQQGWQTYSEVMDGWTHIYVAAPDELSYFYLSYDETDRMLIIMYEGGMDYGFDPKEGL